MNNRGPYIVGHVYMNNFLRKISHKKILICLLCGFGLFVLLSYHFLPEAFKIICYAGLILFVLALVFFSECF